MRYFHFFVMVADNINGKKTSCILSLSEQKYYYCSNLDKEFYKETSALLQLHIDSFTIVDIKKL